MNIDVRERGIGLRYKEGSARATVWAPEAKSVALKAGNEELPLRSTGFGYWESEASILKPGDTYTFVINDELERPDPVSLAQPEGVHGPSALVDTSSFNWTDHQWKNVPLEEYLIYELHTGTFTPQHDFNGIINKLDYLKELGITAIEIMPVAQFPGPRNWGYDGVFPFAVQHSYGGASGLHQLVDACHQKGLAVILDVVYNHLGPEGNYLSDFGPYFTDKYSTPWGKAINFDDAWCDGVRRYFIENVLMWFRDFHIDALRLDAVHAIKDFSPKHILAEIREYVDNLMSSTGRTYYLIVECDLNDTRFINSPDEAGFGMDAQWIDEFHHSLRVAAGEERTGYYADFDGLQHLAKAYRDAYVYDGQFSPHRKKSFGVKTTNGGQQFIVFSQNHDQVGNRMLGERTSQLVSFEMQKLLAAAVLVSPYLPMLFMGEEFGTLSPFQYFISHTDPVLVEAVRKGRRAEFEAFHVNGEAPDPQSQEVFDASVLQWDLLARDPHQTLLKFYKHLICLRKDLPALKHLNRKAVQAEVIEPLQVLVLQRWHQDSRLLCLMNFSKQTQAIASGRYDGSWRLILNSAAKEWGGQHKVSGEFSGGATCHLPPESILLYSNY